MITISDVLKIEGQGTVPEQFTGDQMINPRNIVLVSPDPSDATKSYLIEAQQGARVSRRWHIDETVANIVSNANTDTGYEILVSGTILSLGASEDVSGTVAFNPNRVLRMEDNDDGDAVIWLYDENKGPYHVLVIDASSSSLATTANTTHTQIDNETVEAVNGVPTTPAKTVYFAEGFIRKRVAATDNVSATIEVGAEQRKAYIYSIEAASGSSS